MWIIPTLLAAIPRGQLRGFRSDNTIEVSTLNSLLLLHPQIEQLQVPGSASVCNALLSPWTTNCLRHLTAVIVHVGEFSREGVQKLWVECPKLRRLDLRPSPLVARQPSIDEEYFTSTEVKTDLSRMQDVFANPDVEQSYALELNTLFIGNVILPKTLDTMFQRINALALHELTLDAFSGATQPFGALAAEFRKQKPCLKRLYVVRMPEQATEEFTASLFLLLLSFSGLQKLHLQCINC